MSSYSIPFVSSFLLATGLLAIVVFLSKRFLSGGRDEPGRLHKRISRFGGVALALAFLFAVTMNSDLERTVPLLGLITGAVLVLLVGIWDDLSPLRWWAQLLFQFALGVTLFVFGMRAWVITNPFGDPIFLYPDSMILPSLFVGIFWVVLVMNAVNWVDGVDGLLGGVAMVAFSTIFTVSLRPEVNQPAVAILSAICAGFSLGFLFFNIPPAKVLAGTTGAFLVGFLIAALSLFSGVKVATALLVLAIPVLDALFVIRERLRAGVSPFRGGDDRHLHDKLRLLGWSDRRIMFFYTAFSAAAALASLSLPAAGKFWFFLAVSAVFLSLMLVLGKKLQNRV